MIAKLRLIFAATILLAASLAVSAQVDPAYTPEAGTDAFVEYVNFLSLPDNKILAYVFYGGGSRVVRINADGSIDPTFNCTACDHTATTLALQPDGKYLLAGSSATVPDLIRLNTDGTLDPTFTSGFNSVPNALESQVYAVAPDGKIYAAVVINNSGTLQRLNTDGSIDNTFAPIVFSGMWTHVNFITRIVVLADSKILVAGAHSTLGAIFRVNTDGTKDNTFTSPIFEEADTFNPPIIYGVVPQASGKIVVSGNFFRVNGLDRNNLARLNSDGSVDSASPSIGFSNVGAHILPLSDGQILVMSLGDVRRFSADLSADTFLFGPADPYNLTPDSSDRVVYLTEGRIRRRNADGSPDNTFQFTLIVPGSVTAVAVQSDGKAIVAGDFKYLNGTTQQTIGRLNTDGSLDGLFASGTGFSDSGNVPTILKVAVQPGGKILVLGTFSDYNGTSRPRLARLNTDGTLDVSFVPTVGANVNSMGVQADGKILLFGGSMGINGFARTGVARLNSDGTMDTAFNPIIGSPNVKDAVIQTDGKITIVGDFTTVNTVSRAKMARLNADGTLDASLNAGAIGPLKRIALQPDGKYIIVPLNGALIVRRNADGTPDASFSSPSVLGTNVNAVVVEAGGKIVIGGSFATPGPDIIVIWPRGAPDLTLLPGGANGVVRDLAIQADNKIIAVGDFSVIGGANRANIARLLVHPTPFDFDGDGRADISVTRPGDFNWYQLTGINYNFGAIQFGQVGDRVTPADFDGDGKTDIGVFRPATGDWWYRSSIDGLQHGVHWGQNGDIPLAGDYNGDGNDDLVAVRNYAWWIANAANGQQILFQNFGQAGDKLLVGDFDGDGKTDPAVYRPSEGTWYYAASSNNYTHTGFQWGIAEDIPVPADYDGDGKTDGAVFRPSEGNWYVLNSSNGTWIGLHFGLTGDKPIAADYDGDGKADIAVYRPSDHYWYILGTTAGFYGFPFGLDTDIPSPNAFIP